MVILVVMILIGGLFFFGSFIICSTVVLIRAKGHSSSVGRVLDQAQYFHGFDSRVRQKIFSL